MDLRERTVIQVDNETKSSATRVTVEGRTITYKMEVLQQPVRARACGQGAKSSADRRPVDPPPIVELQIFEGENAQQDITFTMHANYFLFATLEHARPIAHGRVPHERDMHPVLTGTPVAGMVYLDRPKPAGYFIFPDLSVRHEGKYRLSFALFEELKNAKDEDKLPEDSQPNSAGDAHVTHRLEVKSEPFHVYSAKKFPGLTESTSLSRMVAEQGCRVRIRRDVRMRRREQKGAGKEWDDYEDDTAQARARMSATPESNMYPNMHTPSGYMEPIPRPRSASNASHQSLGTSISRRQSLQDMNQAYAQPHFGTAPHTPQNGFSQQAPYGTSPSQSYPPAPFVQQPTMQPPPPQYAQQQYPPPPPQASVQQQGYYSYPTTQAPQVQAPPPHFSAPPPPQFEQVPQPHRQSIDYSAQVQPDFRRNSMQQHPPPPQQNGYSQSQTYPQQGPNQYQSAQPPVSQPSHNYTKSMDMYQNRPAPLEPMHAQGRSNGATTPTASRHVDLPPLSTTGMLSNNKLEPSSPASAVPPQSYGSIQTPVDSNKRSFGNVFSDRHQQQPLRQGARPSTQDYNMAPSSSLSAADDEDGTTDMDVARLSMHYRRADGRSIQRALPGVHN